MCRGWSSRISDGDGIMQLWVIIEAKLAARYFIHLVRHGDIIAIGVEAILTGVAIGDLDAIFR
jgi:hypothetical protein